MNWSFFTLPALLFFIFASGALTLLSARKKGGLTALRSRSEFIFISFLTGFLLASFAGLVLAYGGVFSLFRIAVILLVYSIVVLVLIRPSWKIYWPPAGGMGASLVLLFILVLASLLFFRPVEYIFGGWDPGVYANTAVHIAREGSIVISDEVLPLIPSGKEDVFTRLHTCGYREKYPGFRIGKGDNLVPQFYHLYPVWLAVFYSGVGFSGMFYLTPVLGILSLLAFYLAARELYDRRVALVGVFLLAINIVQIWQSRFPTSEMMGQFLLFSGIFVFSLFLKSGDRIFAGLGGALLGFFILSRISASLLLLPLLVFFYCRWFIRFRKEDLSFWIVLIFLTAASFLPHLFFGPQYLYSVFSDLVLPEAAGRLILIVFAAAAMARILPLRFRYQLRDFFQQKFWRVLAAAAVLALICYGYFVRPYIGNLNPDKLNLVELGWLITPLGLFLATASAIRMILRNRKAEVSFFLLILAAFSGLFLWQQLIHYYYLWAARRYSVIVIPGFLLLASDLIVALSRNRRTGARWTALVLFLLLAVHSAWESRVLWEHKEYRGALDFAATLSEKLKGADLIAVRGDFVDKVPTFLDIACGYRVLPVYGKDEDELAGIYRLGEALAWRDRRPVIFLLTGDVDPPGAALNLLPVAELPYHCSLLERCWDHLPDKIVDDARDANFTVRIFRIEKGGS